jgi:hypothetical protein
MLGKLCGGPPDQWRHPAHELHSSDRAENVRVATKDFVATVTAKRHGHLPTRQA